jgi:hypothetical protein
MRAPAHRLSLAVIGVAMVRSCWPVARLLKAQGPPPVLTREFQGLTGHVGVSVNGGRAEPAFEYGLSY